MIRDKISKVKVELLKSPTLYNSASGRIVHSSSVINPNRESEMPLSPFAFDNSPYRHEALLSPVTGSPLMLSEFQQSTLRARGMSVKVSDAITSLTGVRPDENIPTSPHRNTFMFSDIVSKIPAPRERPERNTFMLSERVPLSQSPPSKPPVMLNIDRSITPPTQEVRSRRLSVTVSDAIASLTISGLKTDSFMISDRLQSVRPPTSKPPSIMTFSKLNENRDSGQLQKSQFSNSPSKLNNIQLPLQSASASESSPRSRRMSLKVSDAIISLTGVAPDSPLNAVPSPDRRNSFMLSELSPLARAPNLAPNYLHNSPANNRLSTLLPKITENNETKRSRRLSVTVSNAISALTGVDPTTDAEYSSERNTFMISDISPIKRSPSKSPNQNSQRRVSKTPLLGESFAEDMMGLLNFDPPAPTSERNTFMITDMSSKISPPKKLPTQRNTFMLSDVTSKISPPIKSPSPPSQRNTFMLSDVSSQIKSPMIGAPPILQSQRHASKTYFGESPPIETILTPRRASKTYFVGETAPTESKSEPRRSSKTYFVGEAAPSFSEFVSSIKPPQHGPPAHLLQNKGSPYMQSKSNSSSPLLSLPKPPTKAPPGKKLYVLINSIAHLLNRANQEGESSNSPLNQGFSLPKPPNKPPPPCKLNIYFN